MVAIVDQAIGAVYVGADAISKMYVGADLMWSSAFNPIAAASWHTAFWTSGPEFAALGLADGAAVATLPDEAGAHDATQATGAKRPIYRAASAGMNNRPVVEFDGLAHALATAAFTALSQPNEIVMIGRVRNAAPGATAVIFTGIASGNVHQFAITTTGPSWRINAGANAAGGTPNTNKHYFRIALDVAQDILNIDGTGIIAGDAGAHTLTGLTLGATVGGGGSYSQLDLAFLGLSDGLLTADQRTALIGWSRDFYATP